ncbi:MAG: hypothetical protein ABIE42_02785 [Candidatus Eisenbacteria bacterium]
MEADRRALSTTLIAALATTVIVLAGCAPRPPTGREPVSDEATRSERHWTCRSLDPVGAERVAGLTELWTVESGSMLSAHHTGRTDDGSPGRSTRNDAVADAIASAADAALDLLEQRGVSYGTDKRQEIVDEVVDAAVRGADFVFPRMTVVARNWDECVAVADDTSADADTSWRAAVLVEYPIGLLRGDVNNVVWERGRAANEAEVLVASADEHLAAGRWHDGLLDAAAVVHVVRETGVRLSRVAEASPATESDGPSSIDDRLREALRWSRVASDAATRLHARPVGSVDVLETGAATGATVQFHCTYEWNGRVVAAVGVPVRFEMPGASAVLHADPLTDGSGAATCRILAAYGPPGEYELTVSVDTAAAHAALTWSLSAGARTDTHDLTELHRFAPLAGHTVHLVAGAHAISVCATFGDQDDAAAAQVMAGFIRRTERDGFRTGRCDPDVNVIVTGEFSLTAHEEPDLWVAQVTLSAAAFDQRTASGLGATRVRATQTSDAEDGEPGRREAEVLALKEAGRLMAVYFGPRMLASGR